MSSKNDLFQIIIFGDDDVVRKFTEYLGYTFQSNKSGLVYFEFPNEKFAHKKFLKVFKYKLHIYIVQPSLLQTIMAPKQQFKTANAIVILSANHNDSIYKECFDYFQKFVLTRRSFVPLLFIGYNLKESSNKRDIGKFFFNLEVAKLYEEIFQVPTSYLNIIEDENDALFFVKFVELLEFSKEFTSKEMSTIVLERMLNNLKDRLVDLKTNPPNNERGICILGEIERVKNLRISRQSLVNLWGLTNEDAKFIVDTWEEHPQLEEIFDEERELLEKDGLEKLNKCRRLNLEPNFVIFLMLGYDFNESKKALAILTQKEILKSIAYHIPSLEYKIYDNLQDLVVISKGRTVYTRTTAKNSDDVTLFSGLIQTIEIVRNKYMADKTGLKDLIKIGDVDILEFGNLYAVIGTGKNDLKIILRFKERPQEIYIEKTKAFIAEFEKTLLEKLDERLLDLSIIRPEIDQLYYQFYNPFPQKASFDQVIKVDSSFNSVRFEQLSNLEKIMIGVIQGQNGLTIAQILSEVKKSTNISESDLLQLIFDLLKEKILI